MTVEEFRKAYESAKAIVESWPAWKQNILEYSDKPTVKVARKPVLVDE